MFGEAESWWRPFLTHHYRSCMLTTMGEVEQDANQETPKR